MTPQQFPSFSLTGNDSTTYTLEDFQGKKTVFYFYPKDDTPGCTLEAKAFAELSPEFEKHSAKVVGVSADSVESHCSFIEKYALTFLLLSDPNKDLINKLGLWVEKNMYGKKSWGIARTTYVVDENGEILKVWNHVKPEGHAQEVLEFVKNQ